jgi:hypothetical protein
MKAKIEEVVDQLKENLELEATYMETNRALIVRNDSTNTDAKCIVFWWSPTIPGIFDTDELEESAWISNDNGRLQTCGIEEFDVETMCEFLEKVKKTLSL